MESGTRGVKFLMRALHLLCCSINLRIKTVSSKMGILLRWKEIP